VQDGGHSRTSSVDGDDGEYGNDANDANDAASAKCIIVTGSIWECQCIVGPESQGGQIPEFTAPMQCPLGVHGSTSQRCAQAWERRRQAYKHLRALMTSLGAPETSLGAR